MVEAVDGERMAREAAELSFPRYPGTEGDVRAVAWVAERLREAGLEVRVEDFSYDLRPVWWALRGMLIGCGLAVGAAGLLAPDRPGLAALLLLALAPGAVFLAWAPWLERLYRRAGPTATANVVGRRAAAGPPRLTLLLLAHHDSKSQNLTFPARMGLTLAALGGTVGLAAYLAPSLSAGLPVGPTAWPRASGLAAALALLALSAIRNGNRSPGGVDNAGSVAVLLHLARRLPGELPPEVELIFLSPGAEEDHMVGAMRWLDANREDLAGRPVWAFNFDGAGAPGRLVLLERYGFGRPFSPALSRLARQVAAAMGERVRGVLMPPAMGIDAIPFAHRGIDCLTLSSGSLGPAVWAVHSAGDRPELLDPSTLARVAGLAEGMARALAGVPPHPNPLPPLGGEGVRTPEAGQRR